MASSNGTCQEAILFDDFLSFGRKFETGMGRTRSYDRIVCSFGAVAGVSFAPQVMNNLSHTQSPFDCIPIIALASRRRWDLVWRKLDTEDGKRQARENLPYLCRLLVCMPPLIPNPRMKAKVTKTNPLLPPPGLVAKVLQMFPESVREGYLDMTMLANHQSFVTNFDLVRAYVEAHPGIVIQPDEDGNLPLHILYSKIGVGPDWDNCPVELLMNHDSVRWRNKSGFLPACSAFGERREEDGIQKDYDFFCAVANVSSSPDKSGEVPTVFRKIIERNPSCLFGKNGILSLISHTLQCAVIQKPRCSDRIVDNFTRRLFDTAFPKGLGTADTDGNCPLHIICNDTVHVDPVFIKTVFDMNPDCVRYLGQGGRLPLANLLLAFIRSGLQLPSGNWSEFYDNWTLSWVARYFHRENAIQLFTRAYPESIFVEDDEGVSPFHIVCDSQWPIEWAEGALDMISLSGAIRNQFAAHIFSDGRRPLHVRLSTKQEFAECGTVCDEDDDNEMASNNGIDLLIISLGPNVVSIVDPITGLMPFVTAAMNQRGAGVLYQILRAHPMVLHDFLPTETQEYGKQPPTKKPRL